MKTRKEPKKLIGIRLTNKVIDILTKVAEEEQTTINKYISGIMSSIADALKDNYPKEIIEEVVKEESDLPIVMETPTLTDEQIQLLDDAWKKTFTIGIDSDSEFMLEGSTSTEIFEKAKEESKTTLEGYFGKGNITDYKL